MDRQAYLEMLLEHYQQPRYREKLADADVAMPGGNPGCGDVVSIYLKVAKGEGQRERVDKVGWIGSGCTISQAAASVVAEMVNEAHSTLDEILDMDYEDLVDTLGREVVSTRPRCATLALGTLKAAVRKYRRDEERRAAGLPVEALPEDEMERFEV
ncbi:MAG TPA: iron-sulfur cluster assembly scaffold protein [Chloroflexota bacterium]|nr:iron-sulfur cluster assembly scaffold protein [Chloroflexota bacterium]